MVLTNVDDDDLGDTVLAHLLDGRLITPDPWDALRSNFSAATIEPALYRSINDRAIANGLLAVLPPDGYTPAPGGVLTLDHVMAAVARDVLGIVKRPRRRDRRSGGPGVELLAPRCRRPGRSAR